MKTHLSKNPKPLFPERELKKQIVGFFLAILIPNPTVNNHDNSKKG